MRPFYLPISTIVVSLQSEGFVKVKSDFSNEVD